MKIFRSADILIPRAASLEDWAVIACDQFTSQPEYWERVARRTKGKPSTGNLFLPEVDLSSNIPDRIRGIYASMDSYLQDGVFETYPDSYIYVERTLKNGTIRCGLIGVIDLEDYDYHLDSQSLIRASEQTVLGRIPVRKEIREAAPLEISHVLMLADDDRMSLIPPLTEHKENFPVLYDFDLMEGGGHITGRLVPADEAKAFDQRLSAYITYQMHRYENLEGLPVVFAVGDGNHSIVTAKDVYEEEKRKHPERDVRHSPLRYTLVELENLYDDVQVIESIYRIVKNTDPARMLRAIRSYCAEDGYPVTWCAGDQEGVIYLDRARGPLAISVLQDFLDYYISEEDGEIDYIHGHEVVRELSRQEGCIGFLMEPIHKSQLFPSLKAGGPLTRKTFSMGQATEKRYYLEARRIR